MNDSPYPARTQLLSGITRQIGLAGSQSGPLGPPCSAFYLMCFRVEDGGETLDELWQITLDGEVALPLDQADAVTPGTVRGALFENAIVTLHADRDRGKARVAWLYGPRYVLLETYPLDRGGNLGPGRVTAIG